MRPNSLSSFTQPDCAAGADSLIEFLDHTAAKHFTDINRRSFELLRLREATRVLDVGCGSGDDVRTMAQFIGERGTVTGLDLSNKMIETARRRNGIHGAKAIFCTGNTQCLPFRDAAFDACRISRLLLHIMDPQRALGEVARVARPGARVVAIEPDFETMVLAHPNREATRKVLNSFCDSFANGWTGRWLPIWFQRAGLGDVAIEGHVIAIDYQFLIRDFQIGGAAERVLSSAQCGEFMADLEAAASVGAFFCAATVFIAHGSKP